MTFADCFKIVYNESASSDQLFWPVKTIYEEDYKGPGCAFCRAAPNKNIKSTGLDTIIALAHIKASRLLIERKTHLLGFTRLQRNSHKALELLDRPSHTANTIADIKLYNFYTITLTAIGDGHRNL